MRAYNSTLKASTKPMVRRAWKKSAPKKRVWHDKSYLDLCRGQPCYLLVPGVCWGAGGIDSVVPCHSNQAKHGKGMGIKANDKFTVPGCMACHQYIDQSGAPKAEKFALWDSAYARWASIRDGETA